jgi:KAP family P-loop domain
MPTTLNPDQIWGEDPASGRQSDLFNRRQEAEQLMAYIESVLGRSPVREDKRAYTIAINAGYGEGKSFFLRRLSEHLSINHPVAFVDAWGDDLSDEPLTALAATLQDALEPFLDKPEVRDRVSNFMSKTGKVAKIVGAGLVRRGLGMLVTGKAVDALEGVLSEVSEDVKEATLEALGGAGQGTLDDGVEAFTTITTQALMEKRVADFHAGKLAVQSMKDSLAAIVATLDGHGQHPPIIIIIDELDRCRPTYAVKLLEEIKHLFDVAGIVFILALHAEQLGHSISGAYGAGFDGRAYLKRFIDREYRLARPSLTPLVDQLCQNSGINENALEWPNLVVSQQSDWKPTFAQLLAEYMNVYGLSARDAFQLVDIVQTSFAIVSSKQSRLQIAYFLPLAIGLLQGLPFGQLPTPQHHTNKAYLPNWTRNNDDLTEFSFAGLADAIQKATLMSRDQLRTAYSATPSDYAIRLVSQNQFLHLDEQPIWAIAEYPRLLGTVSRFSNPQIETIEQRASL